MKSKNTKGFTLVELLIVIGILAVLASVLILIMKPAELFKQSRDSQRMTEMNAINNALNLYISVMSTAHNAPNMGDPTKIYISLPSNTPGGCPVGYTCADVDNYRRTDGLGWIPVDFSEVQSTAGSIFSSLPIDPLNTAEDGEEFFYTYITGDSWALSVPLESEKYTSTTIGDGGPVSDRYELGSDLVLNNLLIGEGEEEPLTYVTSGLVGYWDFHEGAGTTLHDIVNGHNGTITLGAGQITWTTPGVKNAALNFTSGCVDNWINNTDLNFPTGAFTIEIWAKVSSNQTSGEAYIVNNGSGADHDGIRFEIISGPKLQFLTYNNSIGQLSIVDSSIFSNSEYHQMVVERTTDGYNHIYIDHVLDDATLGGAVPWATAIPQAMFELGCDSTHTEQFVGQVASMRIYNKALSLEEVQQNYDYETH